MSTNPQQPPQVMTPHGPDVCFWRQEKGYVMKAIEDLGDRIGDLDKKTDARFKSLEDKLDKYVDAVAKASALAGAQGTEVGELKKSMSLSREEIATLKVKASLLGVASAAALEIVFVLLKQLK